MHEQLSHNVPERHQQIFEEEKNYQISTNLDSGLVLRSCPCGMLLLELLRRWEQSLAVLHSSQHLLHLSQDQNQLQSQHQNQNLHQNQHQNHHQNQHQNQNQHQQVKIRIVISTRSIFLYCSICLNMS